jgi:transcription elongation GreA/GreB family factor
MAEAKKRLLTYAGLKALEDELENLKVVKRKEVAGKKPESRETFQRTQNTMRQKMSREISKPVSKSWKAF